MWRHRSALEENRHTSAPIPTAAPEPKGLAALEAFQRYADAVDADCYRVTCIRMEQDGGKKAFVLDKKAVSREVLRRRKLPGISRKCSGSSNAARTSTIPPVREQAPYSCG